MSLMSKSALFALIVGSLSFLAGDANALTWINCSCSDNVGGYKRSCYSVSNCSDCCCLGLNPSRGCGAALGSKPAKPGGGGKMSIGYESKTGVIVPGNPPKQEKKAPAKS